MYLDGNAVVQLIKAEVRAWVRKIREVFCG